MKQTLVALDMEGVLTPEIWIAVAERTGIAELRRTTRDEPDYDKLMTQRIEILRKQGIGLSRIQEVIGGLTALPGAREFLDELRAECPVIILSDTFEQFAQPLLRQLGWPALLCHRLVVKDDVITGYQLRLKDQKRDSVRSFQALNYRVVAAGDSFNDTTMLAQADKGILFRAPPNIIKEFPKFQAVDSYAELLKRIRSA